MACHAETNWATQKDFIGWQSQNIGGSVIRLEAIATGSVSRQRTKAKRSPEPGRSWPKAWSPLRLTPPTNRPQEMGDSHRRNLRELPDRV
jgi:hypothetical protein